MRSSASIEDMQKKNRIIFTDQQSWLPIVIHECSKYQEQWVLSRQVFEIVGAIVVHYDFLELSFPEQFFAFASGREIGESSLPQLESTSVEAIRAVNVDGTAYVIDVVQYKRPAIQNHWWNGGGPFEMHETLGEVAGGDDTGLT